MTRRDGETTDHGSETGQGVRRARPVVAAAVAVGLVAGAGASLAAGWPFSAGAATDSGAATESVEDSAALEGPRNMVRQALQELVEAGTLTEDQLDAVIEALQAVRKEIQGRRGRHGPEGRDMHGPEGRDMHGPEGRGDHRPEGRGDHRPEGRGDQRPDMHRELLDAAAFVLGLDVEELRSRLKEGATLADIADQEGTSRQDLIDALVATAIDKATERLNDLIPRLVDGDLGPRAES